MLWLSLLGKVGGLLHNGRVLKSNIEGSVVSASPLPGACRYRARDRYRSQWGWGLWFQPVGRQHSVVITWWVCWWWQRCRAAVLCPVAAHRGVSWEPGSAWRLGLLKGSFSSPPSSQCLLSVGTVGFESVGSRPGGQAYRPVITFLWHYENRVGLFTFFRCLFFFPKHCVFKSAIYIDKSIK